MSRKIQSISDVVANHLCTGCGGCAGAFPNAIRMIDDEIEGRRPMAAVPGSDEDKAALKVCAGLALPDRAAGDAVEADWGPVLACWEGHATDDAMRHRGSSGGAVTALAAFALQQEAGAEQVGGVAHIRGKPADPRFNEATISEDRDGLLVGAGSRYAQASPLEIAPDLKTREAPTAFVGKPCDIASLAKMRAQDSALDAKVGVTFAIFCAGAPNLNATEKLLDRLGVPKGAKLTDLRYRGNGWPGLMQAKYLDEQGDEQESEGIPYAEGWGRILQAERRWRCRICDDHTGIFADISVGDPWHAPPEGDVDAGRSLIVARTEKGRALVEAAITAGVIEVETRPRDIIAKAQPNLLATNASTYGRRVAMALLRMPAPPTTPASTFAIWNARLAPKPKMQSVLGTMKRVWRNKLWKPLRLTPMK